MLKALFINGSPRKQWNTAQLLQKALEGARDGGAETEMVNLYDRGMNYKGCMSCFACKVKGGRKGVCLFKDDLQPIMEKAVEADVLVCGSPVYCGLSHGRAPRFYGAVDIPGSELCRLPTPRGAETQTLRHHFHHELPQRGRLPGQRLRHTDGHQRKTAGHVRPDGNHVLVRHVAIQRL